MKIHAHIIAWNEAKFLPFTLDYYSTFCDKIFIHDNMSTDNSDEIYEKYSKVIVKKWETDSKKYNDLILADLKSNCYKELSRPDNPDWVIVCDCDELLYHENLVELLSEYKEDGVTIPNVNGYNMVSEDFPKYDGELITNKIKMGSRINQMYSKNIIFNPEIDVTYLAGAHQHKAKLGKYSKKTELKLLHYKFLGEEYVISRYKALAIRLSDLNKAKGFSRHWNRPPINLIRNLLKNKFKVI